MHGIGIGQDSGTAGDNSLHQPSHIIVTDCPGQYIIENGMIDGREVLDNIKTQHITIAVREVLQAVHGAVRAFPGAVGITVGDKTALEPGLDDLAQGMVHDPITERRGADQALLGLTDGEVHIRTGLILVTAQLLLQLQQVIRQLVLKACRAAQTTLAVCRLVIRSQQVVPGNNALEGWTG